MSARNHCGDAEKQHIMGGFLGVTSQLCAFVSCFPRGGGQIVFLVISSCHHKAQLSFYLRAAGCSTQSLRSYTRCFSISHVLISLCVPPSDSRCLSSTLFFHPHTSALARFISTTSTRGCVSSSGVNTRHTVAVVVMQSALKQSAAAAHSGGLRLPAWC